MRSRRYGIHYFGIFRFAGGYPVLEITAGCALGLNLLRYDLSIDIFLETKCLK